MTINSALSRQKSAGAKALAPRLRGLCVYTVQENARNKHNNIMTTTIDS